MVVAVAVSAAVAASTVLAVDNFGFATSGTQPDGVSQRSSCTFSKQDPLTEKGHCKDPCLETVPKSFRLWCMTSTLVTGLAGHCFPVQG